MDCSDIACTEQFVTINVSVKDGAGVAIPLDRFEVTILGTQEDITREVSNEELELFRNNGSYPLFGDEFSGRYQNGIVEIVFKGFIGDSEVVSENYKVGADCCHVLLISGDLDIIIE
ncbi:MAG: hypothetical protein KAJ23_04450 [Maribacter sp.]|nr:hypothetical protein [Maribacter sp.]